jgi:hypothetical protein
LIKDKKQLLVPGMAFVPDAPHLCEALFSFGPQQSKPDLNGKKNLEDVQNSIMSILRHKFENEINAEDVESMRWAVFASFKRQVGDESLMTTKENIVQVKYKI